MSKYISTHWGTYKVNQDKENNISLDYWEKDSYPTSFGLSLTEAATDHLRIKQPYIRKGWLKNKGKSDIERGKDTFVPMSWDESLDIAANELLKTKNNFGNSSIYAGSYGWVGLVPEDSIMQKVKLTVFLIILGALVLHIKVILMLQLKQSCLILLV